MFTVHPQSFIDYPIFRVSALLGLFPFSDNGPSLRLDKSLFVYSFAFTTAVALLGVLSILDYLIPLLTEFYNQVVLLTYFGFIVLVFPFCLSCSFLKRDLARRTFQALKEIQTTVGKIKLFKLKKRTHLFPLLDISVPVVCVLLIQLTNSNMSSTAFSTFYGLALVGTSLVCSQMSFLVDLIGDILDAGIDFLNEIKHSLIIKRHSRKIHMLVKAVNKLGSVSCSLNDVYSEQILFIILLSFCGFSIHLYYVVFMANLGESINWELLLPQVYTASFYFYVSWRINQSSAETSGKSKQFNTLLYQLMIDDKTNDVLKNEELRLHISMMREVVFTACGFFNLNYAMVHSMIASATSYLVILIQLRGKPGSSKGQPPPTVMTNLTTSPIPPSMTSYL